MLPAEPLQRVLGLLHLALLKGQVLPHGGEGLAGGQVAHMGQVAGHGLQTRGNLALCSQGSK